MKVAIVGGGFTGCMAALHSAREGHEVLLFESSSRLGGVLLDVETDNGNYFNGCQYLRQGSVERLNWPNFFSKFSHEYGGITSLGNNPKRITDDCAQPSMDGMASLIDETPINASAFQRLKAYGPNAEQLISWAQSYGDLKKLDWHCLIPMQLSRLHFPDDKNILRWKMESSRANDLLAIPRKMRGKSAEFAWLPNEGYNPVFVKMHQTLRELGVNIRLNSPITPSLVSERFSIRLRSETIEADAIVWATNPLPLFNRMYGIRMDTPPIKMKLLVGNIREDTQIPVPLPYYWQVFDIDSNVVRLYVYKLGGVIRYSAETFDTTDDASAWLDLQKVMALCGLGSGHQLVSAVKQNRFVNFSTTEFQAFEKFEADLLQHGVIPGGWQHYGREEKVDMIIPLIDHVLKCRAEVYHD